MGFADDLEGSLLQLGASPGSRAFVSVADGVVAVLPRQQATAAASELSANDASAESELLDRRYRIHKRLGQGTTGFLYRVTHQGTRRALVAEVVPPHAADPLAVHFLRTAWMLSGVTHPNVITVSDFGETADGTAFCVTPELRGEPLASRMRVTGLAPRECLEIALQITLGLQAAHDSGLVHARLKPTAIFLAEHEARRRPTAIVQDFGPSPAEPQPHYLAPEQIRGDAIDERTDLYALGLILFEALTGAPPFDRSDPRLLARDHLYAAPPLIRTVSSPLASRPATEALVARLLSKSPESRPANAAAAAASVRAALRLDFATGGHDEVAPASISGTQWPCPDR